MNSLFESIPDRQKKMESNLSPSALNNATIEKFDCKGIDRFLTYRSEFYLGGGAVFLVLCPPTYPFSLHF